MAAAALLHENVWVDRFRVEDAEYAYHQALASQRAGLVVQGVGLQIGVGVDTPEIQARLNAVEQENKDLKSITVTLQAAVAELTARVNALEVGGAKPAAAAPAAKKAAPAADEDDDDFDLFGDDDDEDEEEMAKLKEERQKETDSKKKKKEIIAKSSIVLDVKPWDDETDMAEVEKHCRSLKADGLVWGASKLVPVGYGIKKLQIICIVEDDKVGMDYLEEEIGANEDLVQSVDVFAFNKI